MNILISGDFLIIQNQEDAGRVPKFTIMENLMYYLKQKNYGRKSIMKDR